MPRPLNARAATILAEYTGRTITPDMVKVFPDPKVEGVYAFRLAAGKKKGEWGFDGLLHGWDAELVEECDFDTWPPVSGALKFFV